MAKPKLTAISSGFTVERRWAGEVYVTGRFPQTISLREAKRLHAWLGKFIEAEEVARGDAE